MEHTHKAASGTGPKEGGEDGEGGRVGVSGRARGKGERKVGVSGRVGGQVHWMAIIT